jgi:CheY-like chemotaxis protein
VSVESELGAGSTFHVYLPAIEGASHSRPSAEAQSSVVTGEPPTGTETILLVEDEPLLLELAHCTLQQLGYDVLPCASPDEALRTFAQQATRIDLLFTDVMMPRMNGKQLASRITSLRPDVRVLYSSGYSESVIATRGVVEPGINYISKPYRLADLARKLREVLDPTRPGPRVSGTAPVMKDDVKVSTG